MNQAPVPTPVQTYSSHLIVAVLAGTVVHLAAKQFTNLTAEERWTLSILSALAVSYAHYEYDAPLADYIALKAA